METDSILEIAAYGAWNGGRLVDNSVFENRGMVFKNDIPVTGRSIEERIGVRTRVAAPGDARIGRIAFQDLLDGGGLDPARIKLLVGATNVGEDKYDAGPLIRYPLACLGAGAERVTALDLYAGCPGFNVAVEAVFMLSLAGELEPGDVSVIVGAENIHRARAFRSTDTASIIFGDDSLATALVTGESRPAEGRHTVGETLRRTLSADDPPGGMAAAIHELAGGERIDGLILDNQMGRIQYRVPATAARVQQRLAERAFPAAAAEGRFTRFKDALRFYDEHIRAFAYDIMTLSGDPAFVNRVAGAYVKSGKHRVVAAASLTPDLRFEVTLHRGDGFVFTPPRRGIVDALTSTHGCFSDFIQTLDRGDGEVFGEMDGKGVFLYATRGARRHLKTLLDPHGLTLNDVDLLVEHQANFAMIPLTLEQVLTDRGDGLKTEVRRYLADHMLTNVHTRGNCSVVCMQRLPYDLHRGALAPDEIQGYAVNRNLERLRSAATVLNDSVGAGMTRSSFLQRLR